MPTLPTLLARLGAVQVRRPWLVLGLVLLSLVPAAWLASGLTLRSSFSELLPDDKPSVIEKRRNEGRLTAASTLTVVAEGGDVAALKRFVDALVPRLRTLDPKLVTSVDFGTKEAQAYFEKNQHLYVDLPRLQQIRDDVVAEYDARVQKAMGLDIVEDDAPADLDFGSLDRELTAEADKEKKKQPGVDGYYIGASTPPLAAVLLRTPLDGLSAEAFALRRRIEQVIQEVDPGRFDPRIHIGFTGNLITGAEEQRAVVRDLAHVGVWGVGLVLGVVFLFFLRVRVLVGMGLTILVGCAWSFGAARLTVGYLNSATGFLVSIIAGNGINFGIIYMARYMEARREDRLSVADAVAVAHRETYLATLAAAAAAMMAYGSLSFTEFRGFRHFGIIGGLGMLLCWVATYCFLPAVLVVTERFRPMFEHEPPWRARLRGVYGYPAVWLAERAPRVIVILGVASGVAAVVVAARYLARDPMEYDLTHIRSDSSSHDSSAALSGRVDDVVGRAGQDGRAILTDRLDQVQPLVTELTRRRDAAPPDQKPFSKVVSIYDLLPADQEPKIALLREIADRLERAKRRGFVTDADYARLKRRIPDTLTPLGIPDLPELVARPFTESDGTRGRIVYIVPSEGRSVSDAHYLMLWADSFRQVKLPNGDVIHGTGDPVIFSDMLISVRDDAPKTIALSALGTALVLLIAFRGRSAAWLALASLAVGFSWLLAFLDLRGIKLNFLSFVALPISIGVGADYSLNIVKRRELAGDQALRRVMRETGGAVILCSLTTTLGYLALLLSINGAVRTFGLAAAVGEATTLLAAVILVPAALFWRARARGRP
jgi:hypothetical protein